MQIGKRERRQTNTCKLRDKQADKTRRQTDTETEIQTDRHTALTETKGSTERQSDIGKRTG